MKANKIDFIMALLVLFSLIALPFLTSCSDSSSTSANIACIETEFDPCPDVDDETVIKVF